MLYLRWWYNNHSIHLNFNQQDCTIVHHSDCYAINT
jgi:hypothetical protein